MHRKASERRQKREASFVATLPSHLKCTLCDTSARPEETAIRRRAPRRRFAPTKALKQVHASSQYRDHAVAANHHAPLIRPRVTGTAEQPKRVRRTLTERPSSRPLTDAENRRLLHANDQTPRGRVGQCCTRAIDQKATTRAKQTKQHHSREPHTHTEREKICNCRTGEPCTAYGVRPLVVRKPLTVAKL